MLLLTVSESQLSEESFNQFDGFSSNCGETSDPSKLKGAVKHFQV